MFKKEIKFIADFNSTKLKNYSGFLSLSDIKKSKIHKAILKYVLAEIEQQLFLDRQKLIKNSIFEYNDDRINNYLNLISENIKRTNKFKFEYLSKLVQDSVVFNIHFLIAPNKTLTQFVFGNTNKKSVNEINLSLSHIYYYKYFKKIIPAYLEKKNINSISRSEFIILLKKIDNISKKSHLTDTINTAINSMADFFKVAVSNEIPIQAVYLFLQGKKLTNHYKAIQTKFLDKSITTSSGADIKNVLNSVVLEEEILISNKKEKEINLVEEPIDHKEKEIKESTDILDIEENVQLIPNEELLSSEYEINSKNDDSTTNTIFNENNLTEKFEDIQQQETTSSQTEVEKEEDTNIHEVEKPNATSAISSLINIENLFDSLLPEDKIYDKEEIKITESSIFLESIDNKIDFKFENSTLEESLINEDLILEEESDINQFQSVYEADTELNESILQKEDLFIEDDSEVINQIKETEEKIKEVDEYIVESKIDESNIKDFEEKTTEIEIDTKSELIIEQNENTEILKTTELEDITLSESNDEEMTEVFSDLTYLDKEETEEEPIEELNEEETANINEDEFKDLTVEDENIAQDNNESEILTKTDVLSDTKTLTSSVTFKEMIINQDMSQTIEIIFDYDMEDYQRILNNISESSNESEALKIIDEYCEQNYITTSYPEVEKFKTLISNYFKQQQV
jgi:hypothetical protein